MSTDTYMISYLRNYWFGCKPAIYNYEYALNIVIQNRFNYVYDLYYYDWDEYGL